MQSLTPRQIVAQLDKHIIGQKDAKRSVAIALRNRWRRMHTDADIRQEINPKNILMIGPTGVGKTEIARRLAILSDAPFLKVEATKFTEVGYVGREVDSIIKDLTEVAYKKSKQDALVQIQEIAHKNAVEQVLDILITSVSDLDEKAQEKLNKTRAKFRKKILNKDMDDKEIEIQVHAGSSQVEIVGASNLDEMTENLQEMFQNIQKSNKVVRKVPIKEALKILTEEEANQLIKPDEIKELAVKAVSDNGIVFLDEIDKIISTNEQSNVSRQGVQRDLLPLIEGCSVSTRYGVVDTNHILFIASGAFHLSKPSDLIPELQGRLPIRVELSPLSIDDFYAILTEPDFSLIKQYQAMLKSESIALSFQKEALTTLATLAYNVNKNTENIGARRLHTLLEKLLEDILFDTPDVSKKKYTITQKYVNDKLSSLSKDEDLSRYIL